MESQRGVDADTNSILMIMELEEDMSKKKAGRKGIKKFIISKFKDDIVGTQLEKDMSIIGK